MKTTRDARGITTGDFNGDGISDIAAFGGNQVFIHFQQKDSVQWRTVPMRLESQVVKMIAARCNDDSLWDLIMIAEHPSEIQVYLSKPEEKFSLRWKAPIAQSFEDVVAGDINNDGKVDILLSGKKEPGITVFLGNKNGTFRQPTTILSDYTFSSVSVQDVNEDGINDILAVNWISNEVLLFSGFGKMRFSNPSVLSFEDEPISVVAANLDSNFTKDLAVSFAEKKEIQTFSGDGFGGFVPLQTIPLGYVASQINVGDFNADGKQDIAVFSQEQKNMDILVNDGAGHFEGHAVFAAGRAPAEFVVLADRYQSLADLVILDKARSYLRFLQNSDVRMKRRKQMSYSTALEPTAIITSDLDRDGWLDILVANSASQSFSVLRNYGDGTFEGQIPFPCSFNVSSLVSCLQSDTTSKIIAAGMKEDKISITDVYAKDYSHFSYTLSVPPQPNILWTVMDEKNGYLTILNLDAGELAHGISLMKFQQISQTRFVEQSYSIHSNNPVLGASIGDFDGDGNADLSYLSFNKKMKRIEGYEAKGSPSGEFMQARLSFKIDLLDTVSALLWHADLNRDGIEDLVFLLREPVNLLYTSLGRRDTTFAIPWTDTNYAVNTFSSDRLKFFDANGDRHIDIILDNSLTKTIQVLFGNGNGTFGAPVRLVNSEGLGGFAIEDLNNDGIPELITTDIANGVLKIVSLE